MQRHSTPEQSGGAPEQSGGAPEPPGEASEPPGGAKPLAASATRRRRPLAIALLATVAILAPLAWLWYSSLLPDRYSVMEMGHLDYGGGPAAASPDQAHGQHAEGNATSVADLVLDQQRPADVHVTLEARQETFQLASGRKVDGYTLNGQSPGPAIEAVQGQLVEVRLRNESVAEGTTLHWHGVDVPNAEDGVAGVTQDAVAVGDEYVYRFLADKPGTYWYHSHQKSHQQVPGGMLGPLVIAPKSQDEKVLDQLALVHIYDGVRTVNGFEGDISVSAEPGSRVRIRVINTDNGPMTVWTGSAYRLLAVDGWDLNKPTEVIDQSLVVTAGGRSDLEIEMPEDGSGVRVQLGATNALVLGGTGVDVPHPPQPDTSLDLLSYGSPAALGFDPTSADRSFEYSVGRRPGFVNGRPGLWWSINGDLFPDVPMFVVREGDIVRMQIENNSGDVHPMHLHGHHMVVLSRNGEESTGSPWWVDSLNVADGESYDLAFVADNPGIWMDHCHHLPHAAQGLVAHLMYEGVTAPYLIGEDTGNTPE